MSCREYRWFKQQLHLAEEGTYTNFGWLTDKLHNAILDDPPPHRVGVKKYASDLEKWVKVYANQEIKITKFERTSGYFNEPADLGFFALINLFGSVVKTPSTSV